MGGLYPSPLRDAADMPQLFSTSWEAATQLHPKRDFLPGQPEFKTFTGLTTVDVVGTSIRSRLGFLCLAHPVSWCSKREREV